MKAISFVMPSRNNLPFLQQAYNSIRKHLGYIHEIVLLDDASDDGTWEWMCDINKKDVNSQVYRNKGPERVGHTILYDVGVELSKNEIFGIFHADMIATPDYVDNILKHLDRGKVVCATRIEPPLHPPGPEKIIKNFGLETEEFDELGFIDFATKEGKKRKNETTEGIFAPWVMYKDDFLAIGGHDPLFAPMELEDSDIFNRMFLNEYELIQSRDSFVYHMTCRGSRFKDGLEIEKEIPLPDGTIWYKPKDSEEYLKLRAIKFREWYRKWGSNVLHDENMLPMVAPKYDIGFKVYRTDINLLRELEPWCSTIYLDSGSDYMHEYRQEEQQNTLFNLDERIKLYGIADITKHHDVVVEFDAQKLTKDNFQIIQNLSQILNDSGEIGEMQLDIFKFYITSLETYEKNLIVVK